MQPQAKLLDVVALLDELPEDDIARGQVGTVVEELDARHVVVEFSDDRGRAYAVLPVERARLLVLHYRPVAA